MLPLLHCSGATSSCHPCPSVASASGGLGWHQQDRPIRRRSSAVLPMVTGDEIHWCGLSMTLTASQLCQHLLEGSVAQLSSEELHRRMGRPAAAGLATKLKGAVRPVREALRGAEVGRVHAPTQHENRERTSGQSRQVRIWFRSNRRETAAAARSFPCLLSRQMPHESARGLYFEQESNHIIVIMCLDVWSTRHSER